MPETFSEEEALARVARLTRSRLVALVETHTVTPLERGDGRFYRRVDLARMELLCELADEFEIEGDALSLVASLVDRLHASQAELARLAAALAEEPEDVRRRVGRSLLSGRKPARD